MQAFFTDYGALIAPITAIISTFIAVLVAQFYKDHPVAKVLLVVASGVLSAASIGATIASQRQIVFERTTETARGLAIREGIGNYLEEGKSLKRRCEDASVPLPEAQVADWDKRAKAFLTTNLGASYVTRFSDPTGAIPPIVGGPPDRRPLCLGTYIRLFRLEQFSQQIPL